MKEPKSPKAWANFLVTAWGERFPIKVKIIALEYSNRFPDPLKDIMPASVGAAFEGALYPLRNSGKWAILYNPHIRAPGRINFTLGHEFGHYLNHRHLNPDGFECSDQAVLGYDLDAHRRKLGPVEIHRELMTAAAR
jgi:IrrE N-terminal-like domain